MDAIHTPEHKLITDGLHQQWLKQHVHCPYESQQYHVQMLCAVIHMYGTHINVRIPTHMRQQHLPLYMTTWKLYHIKNNIYFLSYILYLYISLHIYVIVACKYARTHKANPLATMQNTAIITQQANTGMVARQTNPGLVTSWKTVQLAAFIEISI